MRNRAAEASRGAERHLWSVSPWCQATACGPRVNNLVRFLLALGRCCLGTLPACAQASVPVQERCRSVWGGYRKPWCQCKVKGGSACAWSLTACRWASASLPALLVLLLACSAWRGSHFMLSSCPCHRRLLQSRRPAKRGKSSYFGCYICGLSQRCDESAARAHAHQCMSAVKV